MHHYNGEAISAATREQRYRRGRQVQIAAGEMANPADMIHSASWQHKEYTARQLITDDW